MFKDLKDVLTGLALVILAACVFLVIWKSVGGPILAGGVPAVEVKKTQTTVVTVQPSDQSQKREDNSHSQNAIMPSAGGSDNGETR